jgi:hypothetical protein
MTRTEWKYGVAHQAYFEQPDILHFKFSGATTFEDAKRTVEICNEVGSVRPFFLIIDAADSTIEATSRSYIVQNLKPQWFRGIIYTGLGFVQRAMAKALAVALYFTKWNVGIDFVATEQDARAIIHRKRGNTDNGTKAA